MSFSFKTKVILSKTKKPVSVKTNETNKKIKFNVSYKSPNKPKKTSKHRKRGRKKHQNNDVTFQNDKETELDSCGSPIDMKENIDFEIDFVDASHVIDFEAWKQNQTYGTISTEFENYINQIKLYGIPIINTNEKAFIIQNYNYKTNNLFYDKFVHVYRVNNSYICTCASNRLNGECDHTVIVNEIAGSNALKLPCKNDVETIEFHGENVDAMILPLYVNDNTKYGRRLSVYSVKTTTGKYTTVNLNKDWRLTCDLHHSKKYCTCKDAVYQVCILSIYPFVFIQPINMLTFFRKV